MAQNIAVQRLGMIDYEEAWRMQDRLAAQIAAGVQPPTLLLLEHPHTYTFGRSGRAENLLWDESELDRRGVRVHWVDRGGDVTYHGPGQLVGYPLLPLAPGGLHARPPEGRPRRLPRADYVGYVRKLEEVLILALARLGAAGGQVPGLTGVWLQPDVLSRCLRGALRGCGPGGPHKPAKIAAIGVKVDVNGISRHGFALNVDPDMAYWEGIIGCGLSDYPVVSLADLQDPPPPMEMVMDAVVTGFQEVFGFEPVEEEPLRLVDMDSK